MIAGQCLLSVPHAACLLFDLLLQIPVPERVLLLLQMFCLWVGAWFALHAPWLTDLVFLERPPDVVEHIPFLIWNESNVLEMVELHALPDHHLLLVNLSAQFLQFGLRRRRLKRGLQHAMPLPLALQLVLILAWLVTLSCWSPERNVHPLQSLPLPRIISQLGLTAIMSSGTRREKMVRGQGILISP